MLLDLRDLVTDFDLAIGGVIHVGAHLAEEAETYDAIGASPVYWIEANPAVIPTILRKLEQQHPSQVLIEALVLESEREVVNFHVTNYDGMSSSVYNWGTHTSFSPDTVVVQTIQLPSTTLDDLAIVHGFGGCNMMNIDVEGAGLDVLKGGTRLLKQIDILYLEVQTNYVYDSAPLLPELSLWLDQYGFDLAVLGMVEGQGWGDALFVRRSLPAAEVLLG